MPGERAGLQQLLDRPVPIGVGKSVHGPCGGSGLRDQLQAPVGFCQLLGEGRARQGHLLHR